MIFFEVLNEIEGALVYLVDLIIAGFGVLGEGVSDMVLVYDSICPLCIVMISRGLRETYGQRDLSGAWYGIGDGIDKRYELPISIII